ncbi:DegT/DnrJ/EryC1/StrS family aminotransferase, partial [Pseudomonas viridiflava]
HWYVLGNEVKLFEEEFAAYVGVSHCISVANGSDALELALRGLGVSRGDRVVAVANAGFYGSTAIHAVGADPVYADVDSKTLTLCAQSLSAVI